MTMADADGNGSMDLLVGSDDFEVLKYARIHLHLQTMIFRTIKLYTSYTNHICCGTEVFGTRVEAFFLME